MTMFVTAAYAQETAPAEGARARHGRGRDGRCRHAAGTEVPHEGGHGGGLSALRSVDLPVAAPVAGDHLRAVLPVPEEGGLPRLGGILEVRADRIAQDLDQAARMKDEADAAVAAYEQELAEASAKANAIGQTGARRRQGGSRSRAQAGRGRARRQARRGRGAYRHDQGHGHAGGRLDRRGDRRGDRRAADRRQVDKADVAAAVKSVRS